MGGPRRGLRGAAARDALRKGAGISRGARPLALRGRQRPLPGLVRRSGRPGRACRPCTATRSAARARPAGQRGKARRLPSGLDEQVANWSYLVSPGGRSTEILRGAYGLEDEVLETGLPAHGPAAAPGHEAGALAAPRRSGSPTARAWSSTPRPIARTRSTGAVASGSTCGRSRPPARAAGPDAVMLFRKHPFIADAAPTPARADPRRLELPRRHRAALAADVLMTDYSSMLVDFATPAGRCSSSPTTSRLTRPPPEASTCPSRRPCRDRCCVPPELADALRISSPRARRTRSARGLPLDFCPLDDGAASARVVDAIFT